MRALRVLAALCLAVAALAPVRSADACSCRGDLSPTGQFARADLILEARSLGTIEREGSHYAAAVVTRSWRGWVAPIVFLSLGSGACCDCSLGPHFASAGERVVLAGGSSLRWGRASASGCAPPVDPAEAQAEVEALGAGLPNSGLIAGAALLLAIAGVRIRNAKGGRSREIG